ncbi:MAG: guanylate kinase [Lachnospiraceae bacterium]|nr:guanylate kinase [Lachnospiraceae bacterium]
MEKGTLLIVSGFSGAGKGTLIKRLRELHDEYALSISMTTRAPRPGDVDGVDYFFVTKEKFEQTIAEDGLLEYANYVGNYYGTPKAYVEQCRDEGRHVILEIEIQGALQIKKKFPEAKLIFVTPPTAAELRRRLEGRGTETADVIEKRLSRAAEEAEGVENYDYIVVNDDLDTAANRIHEIATKEEAKDVSSFIHIIEQVKEDLKDHRKGE